MSTASRAARSDPRGSFRLRYSLGMKFLALVFTAALMLAQTSGSVESHVAAAKAAAGTDFAGVFNRICTEAVPASAAAPSGRGRGAGAARPPGPPARETWHADPVKVFDNLYFLGQTEYSVWAI